jgi:hypothetical protein
MDVQYIKGQLRHAPAVDINPTIDLLASLLQFTDIEIATFC